jgi:hypothetical protein
MTDKGNGSIKLKVSADEKIVKISSTIAKIIGVPVFSFQAVFKGEILGKEDRLSKKNISDESCLLFV